MEFTAGNLVLLFDMDGTLTESKKLMDPIHELTLHCAANNVDTYLVTGADYTQASSQFSSKGNLFDGMICNNGATFWCRDELLFKDDWYPTPEMLNVLHMLNANSDYLFKATNPIQTRTGMINFAVGGHSMTDTQRAEYIAWDKFSNERQNIADEFNEWFDGEAVAMVAGQTGLDISKPGADKSRAIKYLGEDNYYIFFGDKTMPGGNDYPLAVRIEDSCLGDVIQVNSPEETIELLNAVMEDLQCA